MSDAKDHSERDTHKEVPEEIRSIEQSNGFPNYIYQPSMILPDPADTRECLKLVGLSDKKIIEVEQKFSQLYLAYQAPSCEYDEEYFEEEERQEAEVLKKRT